jgi:hypothetical protein
MANFEDYRWHVGPVQLPILNGYNLLVRECTRDPYIEGKRNLHIPWKKA